MNSLTAAICSMDGCAKTPRRGFYCENHTRELLDMHQGACLTPSCPLPRKGSASYCAAHCEERSAQAIADLNTKRNGHGPTATTVTDDIKPSTASDLLRIINGADVTLRRVRYVWDQRIPLGAMTLMPGEEGIGKTTVITRIVADLTRGKLAGEHSSTPRDIIVIATEDGLEDVAAPRLQQAGADMTRIHFVRARIDSEDDNGRGIIIPRDLDAIGLAVTEHDAALVWVDSLVTTLPDEMKTISYKDTTKVLKALGDWAEQHRIAVVAPWHLNKTAGSDTALRIMDSRAFRTAVRSMLLVVTDPDKPENTNRGIIALDKANAGTLNVPALRYEIRASNFVVDELDETTGEVRAVDASCGVADWIGEVAGDGRQIARDALTPHVVKEGGPQEWLRDYLTGEGEAVRQDVIAAAADAGFSEDQMKRASRTLEVHSRDEKGRNPETGYPWRRAIWSLPSRAPQSGYPSPTAPTAPTGETYLATTTPIYAGQVQSVQSGQSVMDDPTGDRNRPYGETSQNTHSLDPRRCVTCGTQIPAGRVRCQPCWDTHPLA